MGTTTKPQRLWRWLKRLGIGIGALLIGSLVVGVVYEQLARYRAARDYPPPGRLVDIGGRRIHIDCRGTGSPTVIFESGLDPTGSLSWDRVHDVIAQSTRACVYDRAGVMWSDPTPGRQDGETVADDLHATLTGAGITSPLVMVGHSLGGAYVMNYIRRYGAQVKGVVFVDASHPDQATRMSNPKMEKATANAAWVQNVLVATTWTGLVRAISPELKIPGISARTKTIGAAYQPQTIAGSMKEFASLNTILAQAGKLRTLGDRPLVVLTALEPYPREILAATGLTPAEAAQMQTIWRELHAEEARWSTRSQQELVPDSGHFIQDKRPDLVIRAVRDVVAMVRADVVDQAKSQ
ncbi:MULTISPECIES: alpha/beta hydrolase [unclassified Sphingomonas]|nr:MULTISPECIES: alpha/beta hydrolase [unclassified Sphingomonas]